jgi:UPF0755 protein
MVRVRRGRALVVLAVLAAALGAGVTAAVRWWDTPLGGLSAPRVIEIAPGQRVTQIGEQLAAAGVLDLPGLFVWQARIRGQAAHLRAGEYALTAGMSPREVAALLVSGKVLLHPVTLVEGWTAAEALQALHREDFLRATVEALDGAAARSAVEPAGPVEGWLFPDTYLVPKGTTDVEVLKLAHARMQNKLAEVWAQRADGLPLQSPYEALTLASIIEKETGNSDERAHIAAVFINRLRKGMRLQTDPTVIYGLRDHYTGVIHKKDLTTDTPWNTYTRDGLPPTPIALPGLAALTAAVHPARSDDLYFVASGKGDGRHTFSATLAAHNAAVAGYMTRMRAKDNNR